MKRISSRMSETPKRDRFCRKSVNFPALSSSWRASNSGAITDVIEYSRGATVRVAGPGHNLDQALNIRGLLIFLGVVACGPHFTGWSMWSDIRAVGAPIFTYPPFVMLAVALFIALGFGFVNGFHDTANAVATVLDTHSLPANVAVVWLGFFNFIGVLVSSGAVAFGIVALLPVEVIGRE